MKFLLVGVLGIVLSGCNQQPSTGSKNPPTNAASANPITAPVDYLGAVSQAKRAAERTVDLAALQNAIQLFQAQEDRLPTSLDELVRQHYLPAVPKPPPGRQLLYDPRSGAVRLVTAKQ
jgi:uncharacterized lipoprotein YajG